MKTYCRLLAGASIFIVVFSVLTSLNTTISQVYAQSQNETKTSADYIQEARSILKQVSIEYKNGNFTRSEELATSAYLDNVEYAEADLKKHGQSEMVQQLEKMMVTDLREMIKNRGSQDQIDSEIDAIDAKLAQAIAIVPEFPIGATIALMSIIVASITILTRFSDRISLMLK